MRTINDLTLTEYQTLISGINLLIEVSWGGSKARGWHKNRITGEDLAPWEQKGKFAERIALIHSEISEALEGHRKNKEDDHISSMRNEVVELADAIIRIGDLVGVMAKDVGYGSEYDLALAIVQKLAYNAKRLDHSLEERNKDGGKIF